MQRHLPQYRVRELVGRGGMGDVIKVDDPKLARSVALKTMKLGPLATEEQRGRFVREATVLARLAHPNIVPIYDLGADDAGSPFYTMKLVKGRTLQAILKDIRDGVPEAAKQHSLGRLLAVFRKVCDALAFAHSKGVLHRDLKPENIMVGEFGEVLLMDWGLAKFLDGEEEAWSGGAAMSQLQIEQSRASIGPSTLGATLDGALMGTPQYMSPEQAEGKVAELDERSDIFSLGAILYAILTLHPPVEGGSVDEVLRKISAGEIASPSTFGAKSESAGSPTTKGEVLDARVFRPLPHCPGGRVPAALSAVTMRSLSVDKALRYRSVNEFAAEVEAWQSGFATRAENAGFVRQLALLVGRHKGIFTTAAAAWFIITALAVWFVCNIAKAKKQAEAERNVATAAREQAEIERNRTADALTALRKTAPTFAEYARALIEQQRFDDALNAIRTAGELDPPNPDYAVQQGHILETLQRFSEAASAYRAALRERPEDAVAQTNLVLVESLETERAAAKDGATTPLLHLHSELVRQQRTAEALAVLKQFAGDAQRNYDTWRPIVTKLGVPIDSVRYRANEDGTLELNCYGLVEIVDLGPLAGMPLSDLIIGGTSVRDLRPLRGMPLQRLIADGLRELSDLVPLRGMPLRDLNVGRSKVSDLSPLRGMALVKLTAGAPGSRISDISALEGMPLETLSISNIEVLDLRILEPMPLKELKIYLSNVSDLSFLRGKALTSLVISSDQLQDLSPLAGLPLTSLRLVDCKKLEDLSPLRNLPLQSLDLSTGTSISDLSPVAGAPLRTLILHNCRGVKDVTLLASIPTLENVTLPPNASPAPLRALPNLKRLSYRVSVDKAFQVHPAQTVEEFWKEYDAKQAAGKK